jgi:hypothetical protein
MVNYTNKDYITSLSTASTDGIKDGTDKTHSGIFKALENAARGNYIVDYNTASFQQVAGSTRTSFGFSAAINYFRDGVLVSADPASVELASDPDTNNVRYDMIVIGANGALACRTGIASSIPRVVDSLTVGDIPVALVEVLAGASNTKNLTNRKVQLYGYNKETNAVSIGYSNSNTYTETASIIGASTGTTIKNLVGNLSVKDGATGGIIIAGDLVGVGGTVPSKTLHVESDAGTDEIVFIKNTSTDNNKGVFIETVAADTDLALDIKTTGSTSKASITSAGDMTLAGSVTLGGNIIKASDGGSTITLDTDDNVTIAGDLTVGGGDIIGPADAALTIKSDTDLIFRIDSDGDGTETFQFKNGADTEIAALDEVGNLQIDGDLTISGGNITSQVTLDSGAIIATGQTFTKLENSRTLDLGSYSPTGVDSYGLTAAASLAGNVNVGEVVKVIQPTLVAALDPGSRIDCLKRVYYFNTNEKNQAAATNSILAGLAADTNYALMIDGIGGDNDNAQGNLLGGGGFTVLPNPADHDQKIITLVNLSNVNLFVLSSGIGNDTLIAGFQKGFAAQNFTREIHTIDTYDISRFIRSNRYTSIIASPSLVNIPVGGENSLLLRPLESVTLQAKQVAVENQPLNEIQQFQGWYNTNPWAYWMILNKTTGSGTATWIHNVDVAELRLSGAQSGAHIYAERNGGEIHLPASPKMGTQFLIHPIVQTVVKCCNASGGHSNFQGSTSNTAEVIDGGAASDTLAANATTSYIFAPSGKWVKIG